MYVYIPSNLGVRFPVSFCYAYTELRLFGILVFALLVGLIFLPCPWYSTNPISAYNRLHL